MAVEPAYRIKNMVPGMIMLWYGSVASIPSGWHLCDGDMGTPDLRNDFVCGAGLTYAPGLKGGSTFHKHNFTGDGHYHSHKSGTGEQAGTDIDYFTLSSPAVGLTDYGDTRPDFTALCYIMKL